MFSAVCWRVVAYRPMDQSKPAKCQHSLISTICAHQPDRNKSMVSRLLARFKCSLNLRQWEESLEVALGLFWSGDFAAADDIFDGLLRRIVPYLALLDAAPSSRRPASRSHPLSRTRGRAFDSGDVCAMGYLPCSAATAAVGSSSPVCRDGGRRTRPAFHGRRVSGPRRSFGPGHDSIQYLPRPFWP